MRLFTFHFQTNVGLFLICTIGMLSANPIGTARNSDTPRTTYEQGQIGDYNIQLHLKDFQVIALLGGGSLADFGDYDYNYDYADFTVKPSKPTETPGVNATAKPVKPNDSVDPIEPATGTDVTAMVPQQPSTNDTQDSIYSDSNVNSTSEVHLESTQLSDLEHSVNHEDEATEIVIGDLQSNGNISTANVQSIPSPSGQIQVQILDSSQPSTIIPRVIYKSSHLNQFKNIPTINDSTNPRKCPSGFVRDRNSRCRRVRKPLSSSPISLGRLSNLASSFRSTEDRS